MHFFSQRTKYTFSISNSSFTDFYLITNVWLMFHSFAKRHFRFYHFLTRPDIIPTNGRISFLNSLFTFLYATFLAFYFTLYIPTFIIINCNKMITGNGMSIHSRVLPYIQCDDYEGNLFIFFAILVSFNFNCNSIQFSYPYINTKCCCCWY